MTSYQGGTTPHGAGIHHVQATCMVYRKLQQTFIQHMGNGFMPNRNSALIFQVRWPSGVFVAFLTLGRRRRHQDNARALHVFELANST